MTMQALYWDGNRLQVRRNYPVPRIAEKTAVVQVHVAGICSTDVQILQGYMGFQGVPGHEFVGTVSEGPPALVGKRVVGEINFACGNCARCQQGLGRHCPTRRVMGILNADGSFAQYVAIPVANLHLVPDSIADEEAVFTEPLAAVFEIVEQAPVHAATEVVVFGDGKLGLLCAQVLHTTGARVTLIGKHDAKLGIVRKLGVRTVLLSDWKTHQADMVVESTGSTAGLSVAMETVRPRGILVLKSTVARRHTLALAPLVIHEVTVIGSRCGPFSPALHALAQKQITVSPLIDKVYPLAEGVAAMRHARRRGALKVLLRNER